MFDFSTPIVYIPTIFVTIIVVFATIIKKDSYKHTRENIKDLPYYDEIAMSMSYLNRNILPNGRFQYRKNVNAEIVYENNTYNSLRHAGTLYSMYKFEEIEQETKYKIDRILSSKYFMDRYIKKLAENKYIVLSIPQEEGIKFPIAKSGAAGVALCALCNLYQEQEIELEILKGLGEFLLFMQNKSGEIYAYYDLDKKQINKIAEAIYYPAQAAVGLLYLYEIDPQEKWLNAAKNAILYLIETRKNMNMNIPFDHWSILAVRKFIETKLLPEQELGQMRNFVEQMVIPLLNNQITNPKNSYFGAFKDNIRPCSLGTYMEGLADAYFCLNNFQLRSIIFKSISIGCMFLSKVQVKTGVQAGGLPNSANWVQAGVTPNASVIRIDNIQHVVLGWLKYQNIIKSTEKANI